jgi:hypothetical protein
MSPAVRHLDKSELLDAENIPRRRQTDQEPTAGLSGSWIRLGEVIIPILGTVFADLIVQARNFAGCHQ